MTSLSVAMSQGTSLGKGSSILVSAASLSVPVVGSSGFLSSSSVASASDGFGGTTYGRYEILVTAGLREAMWGGSFCPGVVPGMGGTLTGGVGAGAGISPILRVGGIGERWGGGTWRAGDCCGGGCELCRGMLAVLSRPIKGVEVGARLWGMP